MKRALRVAAAVLAFLVGAAAATHARDMRRLRETGIATRNFLAGKVHAEQERAATRLPNGSFLSAEELEARGYLRLHTTEEQEWPVRWRPEELMEAELRERERLPWWERMWPEPERLEDEGGGDAA